MQRASTAPVMRDAASPRVQAEYRLELKAALVRIGACLGVLLVFVLVPSAQFTLPGWLNVSLHTLLETISIVVSALVFSVGWHTLGRERSSNVALACNAFLAVAVLDFVHVLSFEGMPAFVTPSGDGKAIVFFLAARLLAGATLLAMALRPWEKPIGLRSRHWLVALCVGFAAAVSVPGLFLPEVRQLFFVPGRGLTPLKIGLEYLIALLNVAAAAGFWLRMRAPQTFPVVDLFAAACIAALSEFTFTLYASTVDQYTILGHAYKVIAYLLVYRALFVTLVRRPYLQLEAARDEILRLNATLEQRVRERTALLEAANAELEQFSQSVAHDLRSPLAAISAFSSALEGVLPAPLEPRPRHMLARIRASVDRMEEMIQALLGLAHVSRSSLKRERLDVSAMALRVLSAQRDSDPARAVQATVQDAIRMDGDPTLVMLVLQNLIGNAWKFTGGVPRPEIVVGSELVDGEPVCFVRDNGAGFDMAYSGKLFGVFQRLHAAAEFPGHGIGLANVRRIVVRHGGRVWAESAPGQGAVFRFTLGRAAA